MPFIVKHKIAIGTTLSVLFLSFVALVSLSLSPSADVTTQLACGPNATPATLPSSFATSGPVLTVTITSPQENQQESGIFNVSGVISNSNSGPYSVILTFDDGTITTVQTYSPQFAFVVDSARYKPGSYTLSIRATDSKGQSGTAGVDIMIINPSTGASATPVASAVPTMSTSPSAKPSASPTATSVPKRTPSPKTTFNWRTLLTFGRVQASTGCTPTPVALLPQPQSSASASVQPQTAASPLSSPVATESAGLNSQTLQSGTTASPPSSLVSSPAASSEAASNNLLPGQAINSSSSQNNGSASDSTSGIISNQNYQLFAEQKPTKPQAFGTLLNIALTQYPANRFWTGMHYMKGVLLSLIPNKYKASPSEKTAADNLGIGDRWSDQLNQTDQKIKNEWSQNWDILFH